MGLATKLAIHTMSLVCTLQVLRTVKLIDGSVD